MIEAQIFSIRTQHSHSPLLRENASSVGTAKETSLLVYTNLFRLGSKTHIGDFGGHRKRNNFLLIGEMVGFASLQLTLTQTGSNCRYHLVDPYWGGFFLSHSLFLSLHHPQPSTRTTMSQHREDTAAGCCVRLRGVTPQSLLFYPSLVLFSSFSSLTRLHTLLLPR